MSSCPKCWHSDYAYGEICSVCGFWELPEPRQATADLRVLPRPGPELEDPTAFKFGDWRPRSEGDRIPQRRYEVTICTAAGRRFRFLNTERPSLGRTFYGSPIISYSVYQRPISIAEMIPKNDFYLGQVEEP